MGLLSVLFVRVLVLYRHPSLVSSSCTCARFLLSLPIVHDNDDDDDDEDDDDEYGDGGDGVGDEVRGDDDGADDAHMWTSLSVRLVRVLAFSPPPLTNDDDDIHSGVEDVEMVMLIIMMMMMLLICGSFCRSDSCAVRPRLAVISSHTLFPSLLHSSHCCRSHWTVIVV